MIKRILIAVVFIAALAASALFTSLNPGTIALDFGFASVETPLGLAFVLALALGWVLGILSSLFWLTRLASDRRRLRSQLRRSSPIERAVQDERG
jgi:uncharacterized integral membrane protein